MPINKGPPRSRRDTSWEPVAQWYRGWVGAEGSRHHRVLAIPATLDLLQPLSGERVLDIGCGHGVLAPHIAAAGARYTGVDLSPSLIRAARAAHGRDGRFLNGDARDLDRIAALRGITFDAAVFLLSLQDMEPPEAVLAAAARMLSASGRIVLLMKHPCFRVPRQSGWGWDARRKLRFRRVDRYLAPLAVPMKAYGGARPGATRTFHYPLGTYINALAAQGLLVEAMCELPGPDAAQPATDREGDGSHNQDIPLFLGLRARRVSETMHAER